MDPNTAALIRKMQGLLNLNSQEMSNMRTAIAELQKRPRSITEEIDSIPGRRIVYTLSGDQSFTTSQDGTTGNPISFLVSQDGPFVMTHYPAIGWYPNSPSNADHFGQWRPISSYPLPTQQAGGTPSANAQSTILDFIDISYAIQDSGSGRNFQNLVVGPNIISTRDNMIPLPVPTLFAPNTTIQVTITYNNISFAAGNSVDSTGGNLHVDLPGYKIVNL
jgi:hypothetical protein